MENTVNLNTLYPLKRIKHAPEPKKEQIYKRSLESKGDDTKEQEEEEKQEEEEEEEEEGARTSG